MPIQKSDSGLLSNQFQNDKKQGGEYGTPEHGNRLNREEEDDEIMSQQTNTPS